MAVCGSPQQQQQQQQHIFDSSYKPFESNDHHSFANLFDVPSFHSQNLKHYNKNDSSSFCLMNSESLQMCTEGLGFESLDGVEDLKSDASNNSFDSSSSSTGMMKASNASGRGHSIGYIGIDQYYKREKRDARSLPPPITSLGRSGRPSFCFKAYREDGRFVLQEVRIASHEYLQASREDGRLRLAFVHPDDVDDNDDDDDDNDNDGYDIQEGHQIDEEDCDGGEDEGWEVDRIEEHVKGIS